MYPSLSIQNENKDIRHDDYQRELDANQEAFFKFLNVAFPQYSQLLGFLLSNNFNPTTIMAYLEGLEMITKATKFGVIETVIEDNKIRFIKTQVNNRLQQDVYRPADNEIVLSD